MYLPQLPSFGKESLPVTMSVKEISSGSNEWWVGRFRERERERERERDFKNGNWVLFELKL